VDLEFTGAVKTITLTEAAYAQAVKNNTRVISETDASLAALSAIEKMLKNKLFPDMDGSIHFLDAVGRPIIYGTTGNDNIVGTVTTEKVDISKDEFHVGGIGGSVFGFGLDNNLFPYIKNGIAYITGEGNDTITGTSANDLFFGGVGNDTLLGGLGYDTYAFNNGDGQDTIIDSDGKGKINIIGKLTLAHFIIKDDGAWQSESDASIIAKIQGRDLLISYNAGKDSITIKDWTAGKLGITLEQKILTFS
jgi:Ca2+-binding RTX toxin-like protein